MLPPNPVSRSDERGHRVPNSSHEPLEETEGIVPFPWRDAIREHSSSRGRTPRIHSALRFFHRPRELHGLIPNGLTDQESLGSSDRFSTILMEFAQPVGQSQTVVLEQGFPKFEPYLHRDVAELPLFTVHPHLDLHEIPGKRACAEPAAWLNSSTALVQELVHCGPGFISLEGATGSSPVTVNVLEHPQLVTSHSRSLSCPIMKASVSMDLPLHAWLFSMASFVHHDATTTSASPMLAPIGWGLLVSCVFVLSRLRQKRRQLQILDVDDESDVSSSSYEDTQEFGDSDVEHDGGHKNALIDAITIPTGDIELGRMLGRGSLGSIYVGDWEGTMVAVKILAATHAVPGHQNLQLPPNLLSLDSANSTTAASRVPLLRREASALARLRHPCLCSFFGVMDVGSGLAIVLELMTGGSLSTLLLERPPGTIESHIVTRIAWEVTVGLAFLHRNGIMHRDVKPSNVLLDENLHAKVTDFGLSSDNSSDDIDEWSPNLSATELDMNNRLSWYTAPELISHGTQPATQYTERCDVFSYGVLLFELMSPEEFVPPENIPKLAPLSTNYRPPLKLNEDMRAFEPLISQAWDQDPCNRPTMLEIMSAFAQTGLAPSSLLSLAREGAVLAGDDNADSRSSLSEALWGARDDDCRPAKRMAAMAKAKIDWSRS